MDDEEIPWDDLFAGEVADSTANIDAIMQGYCERIKKSSSGVVHARFDELKMATRINGGGLASAAASIFPYRETYQTNALSQKDINELLEPSVHIFDIFNEKYQFRLCELTYGTSYPVDIQMDNGVQDDISQLLSTRFEKRGADIYVLNDDNDLKDCFKYMITSRKMRAILLRLRQG